MEQQRSICDALLHKPFRMEVLIGVVTTLLNSRG
jgi:hypothetical protein